jgi:hypothetical protein
MTAMYYFNYHGLHQNPPQGGGERINVDRRNRLAKVLGYPVGTLVQDGVTVIDWLRSQGHAVTEIQTETPAKP